MTAPKPFSDDEIERELDRWGESSFGKPLTEMCCQLLAQLRQADAVIARRDEQWNEREMTGVVKPGMGDHEIQRQEDDAIARHRARRSFTDGERHEPMGRSQE